MKYIVDLSVDLVKKVQALMSKAGYESLSQFASVAFQNQLLLEESPSEEVANLERTKSSEEGLPSNNLQLDSLLMMNFHPKEIKVISPPTTDRIPNDCLWGQYNRVFPVKITLRVLANLLKGEETIELKSLQSSAVEVAREIGLTLKKEDKKRRNKYGELLSSALPTRRNIVKAENRFINHFVGYYTRAGRIEGAPGALRLLNIVEDADGNHKVGITQDGLDFASIANPVLDENRFDATLGRPESSFYIESVVHNLKREAELMFTILTRIAAGKSSPTELNSELVSFSRGWSPAMTNTIRAGAVSRLRELGLVSRQRDEAKVSYSLTEYGKEILSIYREKGVV